MESRFTNMLDLGAKLQDLKFQYAYPLNKQRGKERIKV